MNREYAFTVGEANALLPHLRATLGRIGELRRAAAKLEKKLKQLRAVWGDDVRRPAHPGHDEYVSSRRSIVAIDREILELIQVELTERGVVVPLDGLERGTVHFPARRGEDPVYLCWTLDEPEVGYWHKRDEGHSARRPIQPS